MNEQTKKMQPHFVQVLANCRKHTNCYMERGELKTFPIFGTRSIVFTPAERPKCLQVHHRYYVHGRLPWQYETDALETMCGDCHFDYHKNKEVKVYRGTPNGLVEVESLTPCMRCSGAGMLKQFDYVQGGICFRCWGACCNKLPRLELLQKWQNQ